jgi:hypothetical protein
VFRFIPELSALVKTLKTVLILSMSVGRPCAILARHCILQSPSVFLSVGLSVDELIMHSNAGVQHDVLEKSLL